VTVTVTGRSMHKQTTPLDPSIAMGSAADKIKGVIPVDAHKNEVIIDAVHVDLNHSTEEPPAVKTGFPWRYVLLTVAVLSVVAIAVGLLCSTSPSGSSTDDPAPITTVSQAVTVSATLDSSSYSGSLKVNYEKGYGIAAGACTSPCASYNTGISIGSSITGRRATTITFTITLSGVSDTAAYTSGCSGSCNPSTLAAAISTATGTTVSVSAISTATVTTSGGGSTSSSDADGFVGSIGFILLITGVGVLIIVVLVFIIVVMKSGDKENKTAADEEALTPCSKHATVQLQSVGVEGMVVHQNELADHAQTENKASLKDTKSAWQ